jgi:outer membrane protein TolC
MLTGCTVGLPKYHPPAIQAPPAYKEAPPPRPGASASQSQDNGQRQLDRAQPADAKIRGDWWAIFNDPELNDLEGQLNINNQNIKTLLRELYGSPRPGARGARAVLSHGLDRPVLQPSRSSGNLGTPAPTRERQSQIYALPLDVSWTPDLFGRIRNEVRNAQYTAQVSAADLENERLTEQADLAEYFFEIRGQDALIKLYTQTVAADQKSLD